MKKKTTPIKLYGKWSRCVLEIDRRLIHKEDKSEAVANFKNIIEELINVD